MHTQRTSTNVVERMLPVITRRSRFKSRLSYEPESEPRELQALGAPRSLRNDPRTKEPRVIAAHDRPSRESGVGE